MLVKQRWKFKADQLSGHSQTDNLLFGKRAYGEIKTFFGKYTNPIGIEFEIENKGDYSWPAKWFFWSTTDDGSLKVNGTELVSVPLSRHNIDYALEELRRFVEANPMLFPSIRTSIHVHVNVQTLSIDKLHALAGVYACCEDLFFDFVDEKRKGNPFCYPLTDTPPHWPNDISKYCALNVEYAVKNLGTIEFRHLQGTTDLVLLRRWLQLICKLYAWVEKTPLAAIHKAINDLNTISSYEFFLTSIFDPLHPLLIDRKDLKAKMENNVLWAKLYMTNVRAI